MSVEQDVINELARRLDATDDVPECRVGDSVSRGGHIWLGVMRPGDPCGCGALRITRTTLSGSRDGLTVVAWEWEPAPAVPPAGDAGEEE